MNPRPLILHVDDNEAGRYATGRMLIAANFDVIPAGTAAEALRALESSHPDLILLDVNLPDINGIELCRRIKTNQATADVPVLQITASSLGVSDLVRSLENGADSYLREPIEPEALLATIHAVLRAKRAESALRVSARQWQTTFDAIGSGVALTDERGVVVRCNSSLERILCRTEVTGRAIEGLLSSSADPRERPFARMQQTLRREEEDIELGSSLYHLSVDPVLDEGGKLIGGVYVVADMTERRKFEEEIRQSQKLESVALLAAGIAHQFNNILTGIMGNASLLLEDADKGGETEQRLNELVRATERAAGLTRQMLAYSGKGRYVIEPLDLSQVIREMTNLLEAAVPARVTIRYELREDLPTTDADRRQLQQAILSLVQNAGDAIGEAEGVVRIRTALARTPAGYSAVCLEVEDNGSGMEEHVKQRMFDPFFTTKFMGRGLGLSAVDGIVRAHRGTVRVRSAPGEGATFTVVLPASVTKTSAPPAQRLRLGAILAVDDEDIVLRLASAALGANGYRVLTACNGAEAVEVFKQHHNEIALVLLDMAMPVMGGEEALERMKEIREDVTVIVSTGYDEGEARRRFHDRNIRDFLQKPYTARQLVDRIRAAVEAGT